MNQEAADGNLRAMNAVLGRGSYSGLPEETLKIYEEILLGHGDEETLDRQYSGNPPSWYSGEEREQREIEQLKVLTYGAEHGCSEYMVKLGEYYLDPKHANQELATYWYGRAADSLNYDARMAFIKWGNKEMLFDRASIGFAEQWKVKSRDYSIIGKISTSVVRFATGFAVGTFSVLFSANTWWQGLIGLAVLILGLWFLFVVYSRSMEYAEKGGFICCLPVILTCFYGIINGWASWTDHGYSIGRFARQAGMYGSISDWCVYGTWIWAIGFLVAIAYGAYKVHKSGDNVVAYILLILGGSFVCYIASMMLTVVFMILFACALGVLLFIASQYKPNNYVIKGAGTWGGDVKATKMYDGTFETENNERYEQHADGRVSKME